MTSNRGPKAWPSGMPATFKTDNWRCRYTFDRHGNNRAVVELIRAERVACQACAMTNRARASMAAPPPIRASVLHAIHDRVGRGALALRD